MPIRFGMVASYDILAGHQKKNGLGFFLPVANLLFTTDASTTWGMGRFYGRDHGTLVYGLQFLGTEFARCARTQLSLFDVKLLATSTISSCLRYIGASDFGVAIFPALSTVLYGQFGR